MRTAAVCAVLLATCALPACDHSSPTEPLPRPTPTATPVATPVPTTTPTPVPTPGSASFTGLALRQPGLVPIAAARVELDGAAHRETTTDGGGAFAFAGLAPGSYAAAVTPPGEARAVVAEVWLVAGDNRQDLAWGPCVRPFGTVTDRATGLPVAGATVSIWTESATTGADGRYTVDFGCGPLVGSTIVMRVTHPDFQPYEEYSRVSFLCTCAFDFTLVHR